VCAGGRHGRLRRKGSNIPTRRGHGRHEDGGMPGSGSRMSWRGSRRPRSAQAQSWRGVVLVAALPGRQHPFESTGGARQGAADAVPDFDGKKLRWTYSLTMPSFDEEEEGLEASTRAAAWATAARPRMELGRRRVQLQAIGQGRLDGEPMGKDEGDGRRERRVYPPKHGDRFGPVGGFSREMAKCPRRCSHASSSRLGNETTTQDNEEQNQAGRGRPRSRHRRPKIGSAERRECR